MLEDDFVDEYLLRLSADPDCRECGGRGCWTEGGDWVPYGSTSVRLPDWLEVCECVDHGLYRALSSLSLIGSAYADTDDGGYMLARAVKENLFAALPHLELTTAYLGNDDASSADCLLWGFRESMATVMPGVACVHLPGYGKLFSISVLAPIKLLEHDGRSVSRVTEHKTADSVLNAVVIRIARLTADRRVKEV